jgi:Domain of unknown function (DUF3854)
VTYYPKSYPRTLSDSHRKMLFQESGIDPTVAEERGYYTARRCSEVPEAFKPYQRRVGLVVPMFSPDGETVGYQLRPDRPRKDGPKYETPEGDSPIVDVHPRMREEVRHGHGPLLVTEGGKTGDAATSSGIPTVVLAGVWMWCVPKVKPYRLKPCFDYIRLEGREVIVAFDSDCMSKANVQDALAALAATLEERGAAVKVIYLPDAEDGSKQGIDDYLAAGGTVAELRLMAAPYQPVDVGAERITRDEKLRAGVEDLERRLLAETWLGMGGASARDVYLKLIESARCRGQVVEDGIRVVKAQGPLALEAKVSSRTLWKALNRLEQWGLIYRDNEGRKHDKSGAFVLRADVSQKGERKAAKESATPQLQAYDPGDLQLRAPRLMWSRPKWKPGKEMRRKYRLGEIQRLPEPREALRRLGKTRGHLLDALDAAGGALTLEQLARAIHRKRARDLVRRKTTEKGRDGLLIWLEEAGIVAIDGETISLTRDWLGRLEEQRERGEEIEAAKVARRRYREKSSYFHTNGPIEAMPTEDPPPLMGPERVEEIVRERAKEDLETRVEDQRRKVGVTPETFVFDKLQALGQIRLALLIEVYEDAGGDPWDILPAVRRMGCPVERLPEFDNRQFVFPPAGRVA